jgi:hypothetical protein
MNILRESMTKVQTIMPYFTVRVWREEPLDAVVDHAELGLQIQAIAREGVDVTDVELAKKILALPRMNAVEVLKHNGNGTVLYRDWP